MTTTNSKNKRPSLGDLTGQTPPSASLARDTLAQLEKLSNKPADVEIPTPVIRQTPKEKPEPEPKPRKKSGGAAAKKWTDADLRRALLEDAEVEAVWVKFATQVKVETRERLNAFVLHGKRKRFNSTRIQDVVDEALSRYLDEQGFGNPDRAAA
ncbi:MAG: hypothetical protein AAGD32_13025 [Planctomycetota bacterium]